MLNFKHSGQMGDIVWSLAFIKEMGGADILYLNVDGRLPFNHTNYEFIKPLLENQPYIKRVELWNGQPVAFDLDAFRRVQNSSWHGTTAEGFYKAHGMSMGVHNHVEPWLHTENIKNDFVIFSRSKVYYNRPIYNSYWIDLLKKENNCIFVGTKEESELFNKQYNSNIKYYSVKDAWELANLIGGCKMWTGNQSLPACIAEAAKVTSHLEVRNDNARNDCIFNRSNLILI